MSAPSSSLTPLRFAATLSMVGLVACATTTPQRLSKPSEPMSCPTANGARAHQGKVRLVSQRSDKNPLVALRVVLEAGSADDPAGKAGLASLTAQLIAKGSTTKRAYAQLLGALYPMAASVNVYVSKEQTVFHGTVHRDNLEAFASIFAEQLTSPGFAPADLARLRGKALDYVTKTLRSGDDEELGKHALHATMYAGHPYGHPVAGNASALSGLTVADVKAFYRAQYGPARLVVGVAGGYPEGWDERFRQTLAAAMSRHAEACAPRAPVAAPPATSGRRATIVVKETRAVAISMGHTLPITRRDPDFYPLFVAASYLGEHRTFNGVLMQNMRGKRGLNYGDYAYIEAFIQDGRSVLPLPNIGRRVQHFEVWIRPVAPKNAAFAIRQALYEVDKLKRDGIPQQGFEDTKAYLAAFSKLWTEDAGRRLGYSIDAELHGRHIAAELTRRLKTMTKADVDRAIRKYLRPGDLHIVAVADPAHAPNLAKTLATDTPSPITYDTAGTPAEILAEDKIIAKHPLKLSPERVETRPAADLFK